MPKKIDKRKLIKYVDTSSNKRKFDKYVSPFINLLNSTTNSTRPKMVGQLSVLFNEFLDDWREKHSNKIANEKDWEQYYRSSKNILKHFELKEKISGEKARINAAKNIYKHFLKLQNEVFPKITLELIQEWVDDLIFQKTFDGMILEQPLAYLCAKIIVKLLLNSNAKLIKSNIHKSDPEMESKGIDYYYEDIKKNIKFFMQIKTGNEEAGDNIRKRQENITKISENIYFCFLKIDIETKDMYLSIYLNGKEIDISEISY